MAPKVMKGIQSVNEHSWITDPSAKLVKSSSVTEKLRLRFMLRRLLVLISRSQVPPKCYTGERKVFKIFL